MRIRTALLAGASLLAMTAHAAADPASIGSLIIGGLLSIPGGTAVLGLFPAASAAAIGTAALGLAVTAANVAMSFIGARRQKTNPNDIKTTTKSQEGPGRYIFGRADGEGEVAFGNTKGYVLSRLIMHAFGPLDSAETYFYDGREVTVEANGDVSSPPWAKPGGSFLRLQTKAGDGTETAWGELTTDFPDLWSANHWLRGIAQTLLSATNPGTGSEKFPRLFQGGLKPVKIRGRWGRFYDPRDESTAWSINGALHCLHFMRQITGMTDAAIDFDSVADVADQAEEALDTLTATASRCQLSGGWKGPLTIDVVLDMLESAGIDVRTGADGRYWLEFIADAPEPEITFLNRHIIDRFPQAGPEGAIRPNVCKLSYFSPERGYEVAEIPLQTFDTEGAYTGPPWARVTAEIEKYGEQEFDLKLPFCCDASQAQRIGRRLFHMARADFGTFTTKFSGLAAWGLRTAEIEVPDVGVDGASVMVRVRLGPARFDDSTGRCEFPFQIIPNILFTPWDPETDEVAPPPVLPILQYESTLDTPAAPAEAVVVYYPGGAVYETRMRFAAVTGGTVAEATYRTFTGGLPNAWGSMAEYAGTGTRWHAYVALNHNGTDVDFRCRFFDADDEGSYFSDILEKRPIGLDSTAAGAPSVDDTDHLDGGIVDGVTLVATASELRVVKMLFEYNYDGSGWTTHTTLNDVRPDVARTVTIDGFINGTVSDKTLQWRVSSYNSADVQGSLASGSVIIPGNPF